MEDQIRLHFYSIEELGKIAALFLSAPINRGKEREACDQIAQSLQYFSRSNANICCEDSCHTVGAIAWEATNEFARFGEWSSDEIKAVKKLIKGMINVAEDVDTTDEEVEIYRMIVSIMAAILV